LQLDQLPLQKGHQSAERKKSSTVPSAFQGFGAIARGRIRRARKNSGLFAHGEAVDIGSVEILDRILIECAADGDRVTEMPVTLS